MKPLTYILGTLAALIVLSFIPFYKQANGKFGNFWETRKANPDTPIITVITQPIVRPLQPIIQNPAVFIPATCPPGYVKVRGGSCVKEEDAIFH